METFQTLLILTSFPALLRHTSMRAGTLSTSASKADKKMGGIPCRPIFLSPFEALVLRVPSLMDMCRNQAGKTVQDQLC